jgi:hypothetical protein
MIRNQSPLFLHEELMLLALRDDTGKVSFGSMHCYAVAGAILAELLLAERISLEPGKKKLINVTSKEPLDNPVIDECLQKIVSAKRRAGLQTWAQRFSSLKRLHHRVAQGLCKRGILRADEDRILLIFRRQVYPELNPQPERRLIERLRKAIFGDSGGVEPRTVLLISLAQAADLLRIPFDKRELRQRKKRIEQLIEAEMFGKATKEAIEAAQAAAVMIACAG